MATNPYAWAQNFYAQEGTRAAQRDADAQQTLLSIFAEEAARQRPYVQMPANLAEAQINRENSAKTMRRYGTGKKPKEKDEEAAKTEPGIQTNEAGEEVIIVGGKEYKL